MPRISNAIGYIFCGGKGTRLKPLTDTIPKPILLKQGNISFAEKNIDLFLSLGVSEILVNYSYGEEYFKKIEEKYKGKVTIVSEIEPLGQGGSIFKSFDKIESYKTLLTTNGDTIFDLDPDIIIDTFNSSMIVYSSLNDRNSPHNLITDKDGNLQGCVMNEKNYYYVSAPETPILTSTFGLISFDIEKLKTIKEKVIVQPFVGIFGQDDIVELLIKEGGNVHVSPIYLQGFHSINSVEEYNIYLSEQNNG